MSTDLIFFGWKGSVPGREKIGAAHFRDFLQYLGGLKAAGAIESFETVLLAPHLGELEGFFLIGGNRSQLDALAASDEWFTHLTRAGFHLEGSGTARGVRDQGAMEWVQRWSSLAPE